MAQKNTKTRTHQKNETSPPKTTRLGLSLALNINIGDCIYIIWTDSAFPYRKGWYTKEQLKEGFTDIIPPVETLGFVADIDKDNIILVASRSVDENNQSEKLMAHPQSIPMGSIKRYVILCMKPSDFNLSPKEANKNAIGKS